MSKIRLSDNFILLIPFLGGFALCASIVIIMLCLAPWEPVSKGTVEMLKSNVLRLQIENDSLKYERGVK